MINFKSLREARLDPVDYTVGSEKGPKGGFRAQVKHTKKGHTMYLGGKMFKSAKDAEGHAKAYLDGYAASGDRGASRAADVYVAKNKSKLVKEDVELDEAFSSFAVPIPSQTLNGKKIGGGKTPIIVKARTAREAIQKAAKQLGVDFKFLKTGKVVKEDLKESVALDEAFKRIPGSMINGELPRAAKDLESVLRGLKAGNDFDEKAFNKVLAALNNIKKSAKSFKSADDVTTPYQYRADPRYKSK
tara:strand:- start:1371 stop:2105 length:735 start_codon:yes stop_codon:yes gene_type:complete